MQLHELRIALRPRTGWEALDLGFVIARTWWPQLIIPWLLWALPALALACLIESHFWSILLLWLFKPYYERAALRQLADSAFGSQATITTAIRSAFKIDLANEFLFFGKFILLRVSLVRSVKLPLSELEQTDQELYRHRSRSMLRTSGGYIQTLTIVGFVAEIMIFLSAELLIVFLATPDPQSFLDNLLVTAGTEDYSPWQPYLIEGLYFLAMFAVAPYYVACGFSLYINRRTELEGWDLELGFRNLAARVASMGLVCLFVLSSTPLALAQGDAYAEQDTAPMDSPSAEDYFSEENRDAFSARIKRISASEVWSEQDYIRVPKFLEDFNLDAPDAQVQQTSPFHTMVALIVKIALTLLVVFAVLGIVASIDFGSLGFGRRTRNSRDHQYQIISLEHRFTEEQAVEAARSAWQRGDIRSALSIIYTAAVHRVSTRFDLQFEDSDTEEDCILKVATLESRLKDAFVQITRFWQTFAYAGRSVDETDFNRLLALYGSLSR